MSPRLTSAAQLEQLKFLGILLGVAIRTKKPLDLYLAPLMWKLLAGMPLGAQDLEEVDLLFVQNMRGIAEIQESGVTEETFSEVRHPEDVQRDTSLWRRHRGDVQRGLSQRRHRERCCDFNQVIN